MVVYGISLAGWFYGPVIIVIILFGLLYALRSQIMPYHCDVLETSWEDIDPKYQLMLRALMNGGGYYSLSTGLFMLVLLLIPFRNGEDWAAYAIGGIGLVGSLPLGYIVYRVKKYTAGNPPFGLMIVVNFLLLGGLVVSLCN